MKKLFTFLIISILILVSLSFAQHTKDCFITNIETIPNGKEIEVRTSDGNLYIFETNKKSNFEIYHNIKVLFKYNDLKTPEDDEILLAW